MVVSKLLRTFVSIIKTKWEILDVIKSFAKSQGFYGRLLKHINEVPSYLDFLEKQNFKDAMDFILYMES